MVPFLDLKTQYHQIAHEIDPAVQRVLASGSYILGDEVAQFESEFAAYLGTPFAVSVSSGLDALRLALMALDLREGDEVITNANTFIATALAISSVGARPVLVDTDALGELTVEAVERAIGPRTRALLPVHLHGLPLAMGPLAKLARERGLYLVEDACQAHGANVDGRRAGAIGTFGCFSFYPGKNLGAYGDGGMVVTADPALADRIRKLRNYGQEKKYHHVAIGYNHRLDEIQAAILRVKLRHLDRWTAARNAVAASYGQRLAGLPLELPVVPPGRTHVFHLYVVKSEQRDALQQHLTQAGIGTLIHYPVPIHLQPAYASLGLAEGSLPVAERLARGVLSLPMYPELTPAQVEEVVAGVRSFFVQS